MEAEINNIAIYALFDGWGKIRYIGRTTWLRKRFSQHCRLRDWVVGIKVLEWTNSKTWRKAEGDWIVYRRQEGDDLENKNNGGGGSLFLTEEHKKKIGDHFRGLKKSSEFGRKVSAGRRGIKMTEEQKAHMKIIQQAKWDNGYTASPEMRRKLSEAGKGRIPWSKGLKLSEETKEKIRQSCKAIVKSPEWIRNVTEARWGKNRKDKGDK